MSLIEKAIKFATDAHKGQVRKYTGEPYVFHCFEVANLVKQGGGTDDMVIAALLHDTIEDTEITNYDIQYHFGVDVVNMVLGLSDISRPEDGNRAARKKIDRNHLHNQSKDIQTIKVFDLISNSRSIRKHDKKFWLTYRKEKIDLLEAMDKVDDKLTQKAIEMI